ncbi:MAG: hypothetical protein ABII89_06870 [Candidatus Omnitrophota bacterium]
MLTFIKRYFLHKDDKGSLEGLVNFGNWREFNMIYSEEGSIRGNHFHKDTAELFIILGGEIEVRVQRVAGGLLVGESQKFLVQKGDVFMIEAEINHVFKVKKQSNWINVLSKAINKNNPDIHRANILK